MVLKYFLDLFDGDLEHMVEKGNGERISITDFISSQLGKSGIATQEFNPFKANFRQDYSNLMGDFKYVGDSITIEVTQIPVEPLAVNRSSSTSLNEVDMLISLRLIKVNKQINLKEITLLNVKIFKIVIND